MYHFSLMTENKALKLLYCHCGHTAVKTWPIILFHISRFCICSTTKTKHTFIFIVFMSNRIILMNYINFLSFFIWTHITIKMVFISSNSSTDITIIIMHQGFPLMAIFIHSRTIRAFFIFNGNIHTIKFSSTL